MTSLSYEPHNSTPTPAADLRRANINETSLVEAAESSNGQGANSQMRKRLLLQTRRKDEFIHEIMFNLDILIYAEICVLYYMECRFFPFFLRILFQIMFLTPKPKFVPQAAKHRPYIGAIVGGNAFCTLMHLLMQRPEAGELSRGYLHGGIIIDFIGQKGPTSKVHLLLMDLLITALQCFMLAVHVEESRLKEGVPAPGATPGTSASINTSQDHDAEERGITRDAGTSSGDIELQQIRHRGAENEGEELCNNDERDQLLSELANRGGQDATSDGPLDLYYSGNVILADFHVLHTLRSQWEDYDSATTTALQTVGTSAGYHFARVNHQLRRLDTMR